MSMKAKLNPNALEYAHWTDSVRLNKRFAWTLYQATHLKQRFDNQQAYMLYWLYHMDIKHARQYAMGYEAQDPFMQMNVRNQLCKLEHEGLLRRVKPGLYTWTEEGHAKIKSRVKVQRGRRVL